MFTLKSIEYADKLLLGIHDDSDDTVEVYSADAVYGFMRAGIVIEGIVMGNDHIIVNDDTVEYRCYADGRVETIEKPVAEPTVTEEVVTEIASEVEETVEEETVAEVTSETVEVASEIQEVPKTEEERISEECQKHGLEVEVVAVHDEYICQKATTEKKPSKAETLKKKLKKAKKQTKKVESKREKAVEVEETVIPSEISNILHNKGVSLEITNKETGVSEVYRFEAGDMIIHSAFTSKEPYGVARTSCDYTYFFGDKVAIYLPSEVVADFEVKDAMLQVIDKIMKFKGIDESPVLLYDRCCGFNTESIQSYAPFSEELETSGQVIEVRFSFNG